MPAAIQLVLKNLPAQRIAVNSQDIRRARLIALHSVQYPLYEAFFKLTDRLIEKNPTLHHLTHETFQLILHVCTLHRMPLMLGPWCPSSANSALSQSRYE